MLSIHLCYHADGEVYHLPGPGPRGASRPSRRCHISYQLRYGRMCGHCPLSMATVKVPNWQVVKVSREGTSGTCIPCRGISRMLNRLIDRWVAVKNMLRRSKTRSSRRFPRSRCRRAPGRRVGTIDAFLIRYRSDASGISAKGFTSC